MSDKKHKKVKMIDSPTSFTDGINIGCRSDGMVFMQFYTDGPEATVESHRTMMTRACAENLAKSLKKALDEASPEDET